MLYSYDVFDTLITRKTGTPKGIFTIIQHILITYPEYSWVPKQLSSDFYTVRINAEEWARQYLSNPEEITLNDIYSTIAKTYCLTDEQQHLLSSLECQIEEENIIGIPENVDMVTRHVQSGNRVVLISDMYLPQDILEKILIGINPIFTTIPLYLSSSVGLRKTTGNLYRHVLNEEQCPASNLLHTGDNKWQDILIPKRLGIKTRLYKPTPILKYEAKLLNEREDSYDIQRTIGLSRCMCILMHGKSPITPVLPVIGSVLYPYVCWVVEHALCNGICDLYFISRDGYVLKIIADALINSKNLPIRTHYIYGSRDAWRVPSSFADAVDVYEPRNTGLSSLDHLSRKLGVTLGDLEDVLPRKFSGDNSLSNSDFREIFQILEKSVISEKISQKWLEKKERVLSYIRQEIDLSCDSFAFVDIGGTGLTIDSLQNILKSAYDYPLKTYYLSVTGNKQLVSSLKDQEKYVWHGSLEQRLLLEALCRAPHGKCIDYHWDETANYILPVFENGDNQLYSLYDEYFMVIKWLAVEFANNYDVVSYKDSRKLFNECISYLSKRPNSELLEFIGDMPFEYDVKTETILTYAPKMSYCLFLSEVMHYLRSGSCVTTTNLQYSLMRGWFPLPVFPHFINSLKIICNVFGFNSILKKIRDILSS